jgi:hypothetical protein
VVIVALLSLSRAPALSSAARLAAQSRGLLGVGSRTLARQSVRTALASPLWRPAQPLARSRRPLCSSSALDPPPPARSDTIAPSAGLEQPHVDLLPTISEEWKGRLRSLTRPAASAMVYKLDAASPLCYRNKAEADVSDELQLAAFAGDVERVSQMLQRLPAGKLPAALQKKVEKTAGAFRAAREAREEAAAATAAGGAGGASVPEAPPEWTLVDRAQLWKWAHPERLLLVRVRCSMATLSEAILAGLVLVRVRGSSSKYSVASPSGGMLRGLLLTTHYSLLTTHYSLLTTHCSLLTAHYSLLTTHCSLLTTHYSLLTTHCSLLAAHYSLLTTRCDGLLTATHY